MESIIINAFLKAKDGYQERLLSELRKVQQGSRKEEGCIQYNVHQSNEDETFVLYEVWRDAHAVELHNESSHYLEYRKNTNDILASREVHKLKFIGE